MVNDQKNNSYDAMESRGKRCTKMSKCRVPLTDVNAQAVGRMQRMHDMSVFKG